MFLIKYHAVCFSALVAALLLGATGCAPSDSDSSGLYQVSNTTIRTPIPGRAVTAGYFNFKNNSDESVTIVGVSSDIASRIEMHTIKNIGEQMRMRPLPEAIVDAGAEVAFASGGHHLMLFDTQLVGSSSILNIELANGVIVEAPFQHTQLIDTDEE